MDPQSSTEYQVGIHPSFKMRVSSPHIQQKVQEEEDKYESSGVQEQPPKKASEKYRYPTQGEELSEQPRSSEDKPRSSEEKQRKQETIKKVAAGFSKQKSLPQKQVIKDDSSDSGSDSDKGSGVGGGDGRKESEDNHDHQEEEQQRLDTQNQFVESKKRARNIEKTGYFFDYEEEVKQQDIDYFDNEEGLPLDQLEVLHTYFHNKNDLASIKMQKKRKKYARRLRKKNVFYTSKCYMLHHLVQNIIFWMIVVICPIVSVYGCVRGHATMGYGAIGLFLGLSFLFDLVFAGQYREREQLRYKLLAYKNGIFVRNNRCTYMVLVALETLFEMIMTYMGLLNIFTDAAFATIVKVESDREGMFLLWSISTASLVLLMIPKFYAMGLAFILMFPCCKRFRVEYSRRKYAFRMLTFNEYRLQALNVEYLEYEKRKIDFIMAIYKFLIQNLPQFIVQVIYLTQTDCGRKNPNHIVYLSVMLAMFNTYFGLFYRLFVYIYTLKKLNSYKRKIEVRISNLQLSNYGFSHIRDKIKGNIKVEALIVSGETYEYLELHEEKEKQLSKVINAFPVKPQIVFLDLNKLKIMNVRQAKSLFLQIDNNFLFLKFLTIQQCLLCPNFILQLKSYLNNNDSLIRVSLAFNQLSQEDCYEALECMLDHPNLEIIQISEQFDQRDLEDDDGRGGRDNFLSVNKGIQKRLQMNVALRKLELRFILVNRQFLQSLFAGLSTNKCLQKLILSHNTLFNAKEREYRVLAKVLEGNNYLLSLDLSNNDSLDSMQAHHEIIIEALEKNHESQLQKLFITTREFDIKALYLNLMEQKPEFLYVYVNEKRLEDVDVQGTGEDN